MKPTDDIRQFFRRAAVDTNPSMDESVLETMLTAHDKKTENHSGPAFPSLRSITMKNPITKLAIAAAIIAAVVLGLFEFIDTNGTSGVVWAEIIQKVETCPGAIWRIQGTGSRDPNDDWPSGYEITWRSEAIRRTDRYRDGRIYRTIYYDLDTRSSIMVAHNAKKYLAETMTDRQVQRARADEDRWSSPQGLVDCCLARKHHALDQKTIEGVLCEGIETTDTSGLPFKSFTGRLWVSVETGYPVLVEIEAIDHGDARRTTTLDQFQWNADLSAENVEPEIPADYQPL